MHLFRAQCEAGVFLNTSSEFWRNSGPERPSGYRVRTDLAVTAQAKGKRLAYSGWFNAVRYPDDARQRVIRDAKDDDQKRRRRLARVFGPDGSELPFEEYYDRVGPTVGWEAPASAGTSGRREVPVEVTRTGKTVMREFIV